jgi:hypothetical protein
VGVRACVKCGRRSVGRRCPRHQLAETARRSARIARNGYGRAHWQQLRKLRFGLAGGLCELRLPGCTRVATHVHLDERLGGNHDAATLADCRACCANCSGAIDAPRSRRPVIA